MNVLPILERELRAEARHAFNYWTRVVAATVAMVVFAIMMLDRQGSAARLGARLFGNLNTALFITIWLLVPLLTADCISRERREGTLSLLFLTPLTARGVVAGKSLIHSLRAAAVLLAALPVLALAFLLGGVTWREAVVALLLDSSSVCLALTAGLVASSRCTQWNRALLLSEVLAVILLCGFGCLLVFGLLRQVAGPYFPGFTWREFPFKAWVMGVAIAYTGVAGIWSEGLGSLSAAATSAWLMTIVEMFLLSLFVSGTGILWVAARLGRSWQEQPPTTRQLWWRRAFVEPRFWKALFRSRMERTLNRNPVGWLQQYSTAARLVKWGWCLFIVLAESLLVASVSWYDMEWPQYGLLTLLALSLAASAAASFRQERETGALELILVTPLSVAQIILGRLRGLWRQILPALGLVLGTLALLIRTGLRDQWSWRWESYSTRDLGASILIACTFASVPLVGLYFSLSRKHFLSAWLSTLCVCLLLPWIVPGYVFLLLYTVLDSSSWHYLRQAAFLDSPLVLAGELQIVFALIAVGLLFRNLARRKFALA